MELLNITVKEICDLVEGQLSLHSSDKVDSADRSDILLESKLQKICSLENAKGADIAVVFDPEDNSVFSPLSIDKVKQCGAGLILASKVVAPEKNYILVKDPLGAMEKLIAFVEKREESTGKNIKIHPSAFVDESATLGDDVLVGPNAVVMGGAQIGQGTEVNASAFVGRQCKVGVGVKIYPGAKILDYCTIGDHSIIHSGAVIGSDGFGYRVMKQGLRKVPHVGIVRVGKHVEIGANTCIDRAEFDETVIGDGVKIDNLVHIAHNVKVGPCSAILAHTGIAGSAVIGAGCQIGGQVAIKDHITIGNRAKIVSKSGVMKSLGDGEVVCGIPSIPFSQWKRMTIAAIKLPEYLRDFKKLKSHFEKKKKGGFWRQLFGR